MHYSKIALMNDSYFTDNFKQEPFWWERSPRPADENNPLPKSADVVIIGSGYTGLSAAIQTAKHGLHTVVVDAESAGWGCSSRNGGQVSTSLKPSFLQLQAKYGRDKAVAILSEGYNALNWVESFTQEANIDCDFKRVGLFCGAHNKAALQGYRDTIANTVPEFETQPFIVEPKDTRKEIDSDDYMGGMVLPHHGSIDPGRYHLGLLAHAKQLGVEVISHCKVDDIRKSAGKFNVSTTKGNISAKDVLVATSGYTGKLTPWQQQRIIPIGSYVIATEPLAEGQLETLIPNDRMVIDSRKVVVYFRSCPERKRIIFGGRVSLNETNPKLSGPKLHALMVQRFPMLHDIKISHSWMGFVGYTFNEMPHLGKQDGIHYSMGYCGSGVSLASYFGMRIGLQIAGQPEGATALDDLNFENRFYYRGNPWFLAPSLFYYRWKDAR
jgi:glycine/D-amino acid oxidase-like deaminating enzyme